MDLVVKNLTKEYGDKIAVDKLNCNIESGQLVGLVGANGAGKTTLIKLITTILTPTKGEIYINGKDIAKDQAFIRKNLGYLPQEVCVYDNLSTFEFLSYVAALKGLNKENSKRQIDQLLEKLNLLGAKNKILKTFSGGMKQRVGIACALLGNPEIIVLDEPTIGLDPQERIAIRNLLSELSRTRIVILSTHIVSDIEAIASKIFIMRNGQLVYDNSPEKLLKTTKGYVWEYTVPRLEGKVRGISNMVQTEEGILVRQISITKPTNKATQVKERLEDACLFMLEGCQ